MLQNGLFLRKKPSYQKTLNFVEKLVLLLENRNVLTSIKIL